MKVILFTVFTIVVSETRCLFIENNNVTRTRRQTNCGFKCKSGECINEDFECDGAVNCKDGSDETDACKRIRCPAFLFRCKYGACLNPDLECDGKQDCRDNSDETSSRCKDSVNPSNCRKNQFACNSGQCISEDDKCDGKADCNDASDETREACNKLVCPGYTYTCSYGACVSQNSRCNGIKECHDGSDELNCPATPVVTRIPPTIKPATQTPPTPQPQPPPDTNKPPPVSNGCVLPPYPTNGRWTVLGKPTVQYGPNDKVEKYTTIKYECQTGYILEQDQSLNYCYEDAKWAIESPKCLQLCPPYVTNEKRIVNCTKNGNKIDCNKATSGTVAVAKCIDFYEDKNFDSYSRRRCFDGTWDGPGINCRPVCGKKNAKSNPLIVNGTRAKKGDYPWQVAIYTIKDNVKEYSCGGSLIDFNIILTAAHCVTNLTTGILLPKENFIVAVGKYYSDFDHPNDKETEQKSEVERIVVPPEYKGDIQHYVADIAILVTKRIFKLSPYVQFICHKISDDQFLQEGNYGVVSGWGLENPDGKMAAKELNEIQVPFISTQKCVEDLDSVDYLTYDKICGGFLNGNKGVCNGDSGSALIFPDFSKRYFSVGIVSISPSGQGNCNTQKYAFYTKFTTHYDWFETTRSKFAARDPST